MSLFLDELNSLPATLSAKPGSSEPDRALQELIDAYVRGIERKWQFLGHHKQVLDRIDWQCVHRLGRVRDAQDKANSLVITMSEARLEITHPDAVTDHVYVAFDGAIAAAVNASDTLGRLINAALSLGLEERFASLSAVAKNCSCESSLGVVLQKDEHFSWLRRLRELRGRCQHADVEDVLISPAGLFVWRSEPRVPGKYWWKESADSVPVSVYVTSAIEAAEETLLACIRALLGDRGAP